MRVSTTIATTMIAARPSTIVRGRICLAVLLSASYLAHVFAHDIGRAEPDEHLQCEVADQNPVELANYRDHVEFERRRSQHEQKAHHRHHLGESRDSNVSDKPVKQPHKLRQIDHHPAHLKRPEELHAQESEHCRYQVGQYSSTVPE